MVTYLKTMKYYEREKYIYSLKCKKALFRDQTNLNTCLIWVYLAGMKDVGGDVGYSWEKKDTKASRVTSKNQGPTAPQS